MGAKRLCPALAVMCVISCAVPVLAQDISGEGSQSGVGVNLNGGSTEDVRLSVTSTGAGWARSSFAQGVGVRASGGNAYEVNRVDVTAKSGLSVQEHESSAAADSQATAIGVQVRGNAADLDAASVQTRATTGDARASSANGDYAQAISGATATGVWLTAPGSLRLSGDSVVEAQSATATTVGGSGEAVASVQAYGARVRQGDAEIRGALNVQATAGRAEASAANFYTEATATASGVEVSEGTVHNAANIRVDAQGGDIVYAQSAVPDASHAFARASGIFGSGTVTNTGTVSVSATGGTITSPGSVRVGSGIATGIASGIATGIETRGDIVQSGSVDVTASGASAVGVGLSGAAVQHRGTLDVRVQGPAGTATGIVATGNVQQSGTISVTASGTAVGVSTTGTVVQTGATSVAASGSGTATGISATDALHAGTTTVTASGVEATATGISATNSVRQIGNVRADASGAGSSAVGISAAGDVMLNGSFFVTASGEGSSGTGLAMQGGTLWAASPVRVQSDGGTAWEVRSTSVDRPVRVLAYNLGLGRETHRTFDGPGAFIMDNSELLLRPAVGFVPNQYYQVQSVDVTTGLNGVQTASELGAAPIGGTVARVTSLHPDLTADMRTLGDGVSGIGGLDVSGPVQAVALRYDPPASMPGESAAARLSTVLYAGTLVRDQMEARVLSASPASEDDHRARMFVRPYAAELRFNGSAAGYRGQVAGAVAGVDWLAQGWVLGLHVGGDETRLDFRGVYSGRDEDSTAVYAGLHAGRQFNNGLMTMFSSTLFRVDHRADHSVGDIRETARSRTLAWYNTASLGYVWRVADGQTIIPEIGLSHVWQFRNNYSTETPPEALNTQFSELNDHELFATAGLRWVGEFPLDSGTLRVHAGGGVRQTLTDGKVRIEQRMAGTEWMAPATSSDRTVGYASVGVGIEGERFSWDVSVLGDFSQRAHAVGAQAVLRWAF